MSNYPDGLSASVYCVMEGCVGRGPCPRCGETNYAWMGYWGAVASAAKRWNVSEDEAMRRIGEHEEAKWARFQKRCPHAEYGSDGTCVACGLEMPA